MFKTVRSKFTLGYLSLVLVICFLGVVSIYTMSSISTTIEGLITTNYNSIDRLNRMTDALWGQRMAVEEYLNGDSVQAAIRFMLASKKSSPIITRFRALFLTISLAISFVSSSKSTTWSESQRTGRVTCSAISGKNVKRAGILSDTISVG